MCRGVGDRLSRARPLLFSSALVTQVTSASFDAL